MERVSLALLNSALTPTVEQSRKLLPDEQVAELALLIDQLQATRWPQQDVSESVEGMLYDLEQLSVKYSLPQVREALAEMRILPDQKFFPRPDEIATQIERRRERKMLPTASETMARLAKQETWFWDWVKCRMQDKDTKGMTLQQFLNSVKSAGYTGRRAEDCPYDELRGGAA